MTSAAMASATGTIRGQMQGSCRPPMEISRGAPLRSTVRCGCPLDAPGLTALRAALRPPVEITPDTREIQSVIRRVDRILD